MTETTNFIELDELYRAGILTQHEHAEAAHKLRARSAVHVVRSRHAVGSAARVPRHAKPPRSRWPAIAAAVVLFAAVVTTAVVLARPKHHHPQATALTPSQSAAQSAPIILGVPVNSAIAINLDGANARVTVSSLTPLSQTPGAAAQATSTTARKATTGNDTTYSASVTVVGVSGSFALDPSSFSAHTAAGQSFPVAPVARNPLARTTVAVGKQVQATIAFTVPTGQRITAILFTTSLGEQLGLWSIP